jgi:hypothetical protein
MINLSACRTGEFYRRNFGRELLKESIGRRGIFQRSQGMATMAST